MPSTHDRQKIALPTRKLAVYLGILVLAASALATLVPLLIFDTWEKRAQFGDSFGFLGTIFTGLGLVALWLALRVEQQTSLESELNREYRKLIPSIPLGAWTSRASTVEQARDIGLQISDDDPTLQDAYCYFDLCNTQAQFRQHLSSQTWQSWEAGIIENLCREWFLARYEKIVSMCAANPSPSAGPAAAHFQSLDPLVAKARDRLRRSNRET